MKLLGIIFALLTAVNAALLAIDYGQEYTKAILIAPNVQLDVILSPDSKRKDINGVSITPLSNEESAVTRSYGSHAISSCVRNPAGCFTYVKSLLGKSTQDPAVTTFKQNHPGVEITPPVDGRNATAFAIHGTHYPIEEVVAMNFAELKRRALDVWNAASPNSVNVIDECVITVPRYFTKAEKVALIDAAKIAGLKVAALVDDGVATAIAYAEHREFSDEKIYHVIYDMGAGSTKATLVSFSKVNDTIAVEVEGYGYDRALGGQAFTAVLKDILIEKFLAQNSDVDRESFLQNAKAMNRLWQSADKAKLVLSANAETQISSDLLFADHDFKCVVSREEFEAKAAESIDRAALPLEKALGKHDLEDVTSVILSGGAMRIPAVQKKLTSYLGGPDLVAKNVNADEAAVFGLTLRGAALAGYRSRRKFNVVDYLEHTYKIDESSEDIPANSVGKTITYNVSKETFELFEDGELIEGYALTGRKLSTDCQANLTVDFSGIVGVDFVKCGDVFESDLVTGYFGPQPMTKKEIKQSTANLAHMDKQDEERVYRDEIINTLEASLYDLRGFLDDDEMVAKQPADLVARARKLVDNSLAWLEGSGSQSSSSEIEERLSDVNAHMRDLAAFVDTPDDAITLEAFTKLCNQSSDLMAELQDFMVTMSEDAMHMKEQYEKNKADFEGVNKQLNVPNKDATEKDLKKAIDDIQSFVTNVKALEQSPDKVEAMPRNKLVELRQKALEYIEKLNHSYQALQAVHDLRITYLKEQLRQFRRQRAQAKRAKKEKARKKVNEEFEEKKVSYSEKQSSRMAASASKKASKESVASAALKKYRASTASEASKSAAAAAAAAAAADTEISGSEVTGAPNSAAASEDAHDEL